jgi:hypothetical protein
MEHVDTLKAYKELMAAGIPDKQAEAQVYFLDNAFEKAVFNLSTKEDLKELRGELKSEIKALDNKFDNKFEIINAKLNWIIGVGVTLFLSLSAGMGATFWFVMKQLIFITANLPK